MLLAGALGACSKGGGAEHGRYIVNIASCNDCHTPGFMEKGLAVPEADRLTGVPVGYQGPWGTSYAPNLRLSAGSLSEKDWVTMLKTRQGLPPMPWPALNAMSEADARAVYAYLKSLGPKGEAMPTALPPGAAPKTPYFDFVPKAP
jgi:mono/diheme cytochrome c family protein